MASCRLLHDTGERQHENPGAAGHGWQDVRTEQVVWDPVLRSVDSRVTVQSRINHASTSQGQELCASVAKHQGEIESVSDKHVLLSLRASAEVEFSLTL